MPQSLSLALLRDPPLRETYLLCRAAREQHEEIVDAIANDRAACDRQRLADSIATLWQAQVAFMLALREYTSGERTVH